MWRDGMGWDSMWSGDVWYDGMGYVGIWCDVHVMCDIRCKGIGYVGIRYDVHVMCLLHVTGYVWIRYDVHVMCDITCDGMGLDLMWCTCDVVCDMWRDGLGFDLMWCGIVWCTLFCIIKCSDQSIISISCSLQIRLRIRRIPIHQREQFLHRSPGRLSLLQDNLQTRYRHGREESSSHNRRVLHILHPRERQRLGSRLQAAYK